MSFQIAGVGITPPAGARQFQHLITISSFLEAIRGKYICGCYVRPNARPTVQTVSIPDTCIGQLIIDGSGNYRLLGDVYKNPLIFFPTPVLVTQVPPNSLALDYSSVNVIDVLFNCSVDLDVYFSDKPETLFPDIFEL